MAPLIDVGFCFTGGMAMGYLLPVPFHPCLPPRHFWDCEFCRRLMTMLNPPSEAGATAREWLPAGYARFFFTDHLYELLHSTVPASFRMDAAPYRRG